MRKRTKEFYEKMNRIVEKLAIIDLKPRESKYCFALLRKTLLWGKYKDCISRGQYSLMTSIKENHISDVRKSLKEKNIIYKNGNIEGFNLNTELWGIVPIQGLLKTVPVEGLNSPRRGVENSPHTGTYKETKKNLTKEGKDFYKKLSRKEIDKLEGDQWYKAIMWNVGEFSIFYIEGTISDYPYNIRMSCWYKYEEAVNVRNKEAFFSHLLRNYQEDLKKGSEID